MLAANVSTDELQSPQFFTGSSVGDNKDAAALFSLL